MQTVNTWSITGRLVKDPILKDVRDTTVANTSVAVNNRKKVDGEYTDSPIFANIEAWGFQAKVLSELKQGDPVYIEGALFNDVWETDDGEKRYSLRLICNKVVPVAKYERSDDNNEQKPAKKTKTTKPVAASTDDDMPF